MTVFSIGSSKNTITSPVTESPNDVLDVLYYHEIFERLSLKNNSERTSETGRQEPIEKTFAPGIGEAKCFS